MCVWGGGGGCYGHITEIYSILYNSNNLVTSAYPHCAHCADNTLEQQTFYDEYRVVLHACCRGAYAKYISCGNRPGDLSLFHSSTCKKYVILYYYGVRRTCMVSFTHG